MFYRGAAFLIDKLEVRIPADQPYTREFGELYSHLTLGGGPSPFHEGKHYTSTGDLRDYGYSAILHSGLKHGKKPNHKVELVETGEMTYAGMVHEISRIYEFRSSKKLGQLGVIRTDLTADVPGVPVSYFHRSMRVRFKRWAAELGEYSQMGMRGVETVYFGKRPRTVRVYNKTAERLNHYRKLTRNVSADAEVPSFAECYGFPDDYLLTRVERVMHGRLPETISTLSRLKNAPDFNPFSNVEFLTGGMRAEPPRGSEHFDTWAAGMYLRMQCEEMGMQAFRRWMAGHVGKNVDRTMKQYTRFFPEAESTVTAKNLYDIYRVSAAKQIAA